MKSRFLVLVALLIALPAFADSRGELTGLRMSEQLADYITRNMINKNTSNNVDIPLATGKSFNVLVAKTPVATITSTLSTIPALGTTSETVAGAGTTVADAAQLAGTKYVHQITGANGTVGWKFATTTPILSVQILLNTTAGVAKIYGESGSTVNGGSADAAFTALTGIKPIICIKTAALTYLCS